MNKKIATITVALVVTGSLIAMAPPPSEGADFVYSGQDDNEACRLLMKSLRAINSEWEVEQFDNLPMVVLRRPDVQGEFQPVLLIEPKMVLRGMDRIVFHSMFAGEAGLSRNLKGLQFFNKLNSEVAGMSFSVMDDGKVTVESCLDLRNNLPGRDLAEFIEDIDTTYRMLLVNPDTKDGMLKYFSERPANGRDA
jgi:hypothetical protein